MDLFYILAFILYYFDIETVLCKNVCTLLSLFLTMFLLLPTFELFLKIKRYIKKSLIKNK